MKLRLTCEAAPAPTTTPLLLLCYRCCRGVRVVTPRDLPSCRRILFASPVLTTRDLPTRRTFIAGSPAGDCAERRLATFPTMLYSVACVRLGGSTTSCRRHTTSADLKAVCFHHEVRTARNATSSPHLPSLTAGMPPRCASAIGLQLLLPPSERYHLFFNKISRVLHRGSRCNYSLRRSTLAALVPSAIAPLAELGRAAVPVVSRSVAPPTGHRTLRLFRLPSPCSSSCPPVHIFVPVTFPFLAASSIDDGRVGLRLFERRRPAHNLIVPCVPRPSSPSRKSQILHFFSAHYDWCVHFLPEPPAIATTRATSAMCL